MSQDKGKLIVFEGLDGSGKSSQIQLVNEFLGRKGIKTLITRAPGGSELGSYIRNYFLDPNRKPSAPLTDALLMAADLIQLCYETIIPSVEQGVWVLCDRFTLSLLTYQGFGNVVQKSKIRDLISDVDSLIVQNLIFYLDVDPAIGLSRKRAQKELDRVEQQDFEFHHRVARGYSTVWNTLEADYAIKINANNTKETVFFDICQYLNIVFKYELQKSEEEIKKQELLSFSCI
jgi:dTMP kinase